MGACAASWLALLVAGLSVAVFVGILVLFALLRSAQMPSNLGTRFTLIDLLVGVPFLAFPLVGARASRLVAPTHPTS